METVEEYLKSLRHLAGEAAASAERTRRRDEQLRSELEGAQRLADAALAGHARLRAEVADRIGSARQALDRVGLAELLPEAPEPAAGGTRDPARALAEVRAAAGALDAELAAFA